MTVSDTSPSSRRRVVPINCISLKEAKVASDDIKPAWIETDAHTTYRHLLRTGFVEERALYEKSDAECGWWWKMLETFAAADRIGVRRSGTRFGGGEFWAP